MGYIYLLESSDNDETVYKIGFTRNSNISKRISELQTGNKDNIREVYKYESEYNQKLERALQNHYKHRKIKNEWFRLELKEVVNFKNLCEKLEKGFDALKDNTYFNKEKPDYF
jgi:formyltetrahydrofolate synthetase